MADKDPGESIVRPSSRGPSFLTLTLKIYEGVFAHKDIVEGGKEHKDITSLLRIGKTLKIGDDTFEDLDEVSVPQALLSGILYSSYGFLLAGAYFLICFIHFCVGDGPLC